MNGGMTFTFQDDANLSTSDDFISGDMMENNFAFKSLNR